MPRLELIFPHSKSADGCNARSVPTAPRLLLKIICCTSRSCRLRHAGAMQIISLCMAPFPACKLFRHLLGFLARPKRFELLTPQIRSLLPRRTQRLPASWIRCFAKRVLKPNRRPRLPLANHLPYEFRANKAKTHTAPVAPHRTVGSYSNWRSAGTAASRDRALRPSASELVAWKLAKLSSLVLKRGLAVTTSDRSGRMSDDGIKHLF